MTRIAVDPARRVGRLDRNVFGGFVEHLGRCVYGGLYDEGSPLSDAEGFRIDVLDLLRELRMGVLRWPGGNFASNYHWTDGIGPKESRPHRPELAWGGVDTNSFGTDEFLRYCATLGTDPYICLNMGTGTLEEALGWIEYCNEERRTHWAQRRAANGRAEPYGVTYWGLGNEMYGHWQVGALSAEEYVAEATRWARAIRMLDPDVKLRPDRAAVAAGAEEGVRGAAAVAEAFAGRARAAQLALIDGRPGAVWAPGGQPRVVFAFTVHRDKITAIDVIADPGRVRELDLVVGDW